MKSKSRRIEKIPKEFKSLVKTDLSQFAKMIREVRITNKLTQQELSDILNIETRFLQKIESNSGHPSLELYFTILRALDIKLNYK